MLRTKRSRSGSWGFCGSTRIWVQNAALTADVVALSGGYSREEAIAAIHEHSDKDLIKSVEAGAVVFTAGPFEDKSQVDALVAALKAAGVENVSVTESASE